MNAQTQSLSRIAWGRLQRNPMGMAALWVVSLFLLMIVASALGLIAKDWNTQWAQSFAPPFFMESSLTNQAEELSPVPTVKGPVDLYGLVDPLEPVMKAWREQAALQGHSEAQNSVDQVLAPKSSSLLLGADKWGRSVALKVIKGAETSVMVGMASALLATCIGTLLGALAGYLGAWVDAVIEWLYGVFTAIPYLLLVFAIAAVLQQKGVFTIVLILGLTGWTGVYRLIRAEYLKHKAREYVQAARAIGASDLRRMFIHILPNVSHVILVQLSQQVVNFIKAEVILSFLGFGVPVDVVSWGSILNETPNELILGYGWQLIVCGLAMAILVTAFAMLTDALRDALDPRLK